RDRIRASAEAQSGRRGLAVTSSGSDASAEAPGLGDVAATAGAGLGDGSAGAPADGGDVSAETPQFGDAAARTGTGEPVNRPQATNADALVLMAETLLAAGPAQRPAGDRYQVVVHIDAAELAGDSAHRGRCELDDGPPLPAETARRIACDASLVPI